MASQLVKGNLFEVGFGGQIVAFIDPDGNFTCYDKEKMVEVLRSVGTVLKSLSHLESRLKSSLQKG